MVKHSPRPHNCRTGHLTSYIERERLREMCKDWKSLVTSVQNYCYHFQFIILAVMRATSVSAHSDFFFVFFSYEFKHQPHQTTNIWENFFRSRQNATFLWCVKNFQICPLFALVSSRFGRSCDACSGTCDFSLPFISFEKKWHSFYPLVEKAAKMLCSAMWESQRYWKWLSNAQDSLLWWNMPN